MESALQMLGAVHRVGPRQPDSEPVAAEPRLFVGQVPTDKTAEDLQPLFQSYGVIRNLHMVKQANGRSAGCAMVLYEKFAEAEAAMEAHNGITVLEGGKGRPLVVHFANPRKGGPGQVAEAGIAPKKLFIGQVPKGVTEDQLKPLFEPYGEVEYLSVLRTNKGQGPSAGCAFVQFKKWVQAENAIEAHNGKTRITAADPPLVVKFADAKKQSERPGGAVPLAPGERPQQQQMQQVDIAGPLLGRKRSAGGDGWQQGGMSKRHSSDVLSSLDSPYANNHSSRNQVLDYGPLGGLEAAGLGLGAYAGLGLGDSSPLHHTLQQYNVTAGMLGLSGIPGQLGLDASNLATLSGFSAGLQSQILSASLLGNQLQDYQRVADLLMLQQSQQQFNGLTGKYGNNGMGLGNLGGYLDLGLGNGGGDRSPLHNNSGGIDNLSELTGFAAGLGNLDTLSGLNQSGLHDLSSRLTMGRLGGLTNSNGLYANGMSTGLSSGRLNGLDKLGFNVMPDSPRRLSPPYQPAGSASPADRRSSPSKIPVKPNGRLGTGIIDDAANNWKLFVGQVPQEATQDDLWQVFAPVGEILELYILRNNNGRSRGCAFVTYADEFLAREAIAQLNGCQYTGKTLVVKYADRAGAGKPYPHLGLLASMA